MAEYNDKYTATPFTGKNVGVIWGVKREGITLAAGDGIVKTFTIDPDTYGPFYPRESYAKDFVSTKDDVTVYDDGVEATITTWTPSTGVAELSSVPADKSVMTADVVEQRELFIAQSLSLKPKRESDTLDQLRVSESRKTFGNTEWTLTVDYKTASADLAKLIFEEDESNPGRYLYPETPPKLYAVVIVETTVAGSTTIEKLYYCENIDGDFSDLLNVKAGKDAAETNFEMTTGTSPVMIIPSEVT